MIEFGKTLREAREAKGYSVSQLAELTHLMHQIVEDLECDNFSRIAAPIYGRGFVKLYCEAVGLDPKPLVAEYMAIQNGERAASIHVREIAMPKPAEKPVPQPPPPPPQPSPKVVPLFDDEPAMPPPTPQKEIAVATPHAEPRKQLAPLRPPSPLPDPGKGKIPQVPGYAWRFALVALVAAGLLWGIIAGGCALYRATMEVPSKDQNTEEVQENAPVSVEPETDASGPRTPIVIPPLYIE